MNLRPIWVIVVLTVVALLPILISGRRLAQAKAQFSTTTMAFAQTSCDTQEIVDLRGRVERVGLAERPTQDVIAQVNAVLGQIGVPTIGLKSLVPEGDSLLNSAGERGLGGGLEYRRQSLKLVLDNLSVQEIGSFLAAWRKSPSGNIWTPTRIELTHNRSSGSGKTESNRYDLSVLISAVYVASTKEVP